MMKSKMAINPLEIGFIKRWPHFKLFTEFIIVLLVIDLVAGHTELSSKHHSNHVCNHQHPKAHEVRKTIDRIVFFCFFLFISCSLDFFSCVERYTCKLISSSLSLPHALRVFLSIFLYPSIRFVVRIWTQFSELCNSFVINHVCRLAESMGF